MVLGGKKIQMMKNIVYKSIDIQPILVLQLTICPIQVLLQDMFLYLALIQKIHQKFEFNLLQLIQEILQARPGKTKKKKVRDLIKIYTLTTCYHGFSNPIWIFLGLTLLVYFGFSGLLFSLHYQISTRTVWNKHTGRLVFGPPVFLFDILLNKNSETVSNKAVQVEIFWQNE